MQNRTVRSITILGFALTLILGFQNFTSIPLERLKLAKLQPDLLVAYAEDNDIRRLAPSRPRNFEKSEQPKLAAPKSGHDLGSISQDWMTRQTHLLTGGADQRFLDDVNKKLHRALKREKQIPQDSGKDPGLNQPRAEDEEPSLIAPSVKFTSLYRVEFGFSNQANVSCSVEGSNLRWDLSRPLSERIDFNLRHETSGNSVRLHYNW